MCWIKLYIAGQTPKSLQAASLLKTALETMLPGRYRLEVIDLLNDPEATERDNVFATPTAIRVEPLPVRRALGDFTNAEKVLAALDLKK